MTTPLYLCLHAASFPAQCLLRLRTELRSEAVAVLDESSVCAFNRAAASLGVVRGLAQKDAQALDGLQLFARSTSTEEAARSVLLEVAMRFAPRMEDASHAHVCSLVLDVSGAEQLYGSIASLAERLRAAAADAGFRVSIASSGNFHTARMVAAGISGITHVPSGREAQFLEKLPLELLDLPADPYETFAPWGLRTLGQLAALPEADLVALLGAQARPWQAMANGSAAHAFQPIEPALELLEHCAFEDSALSGMQPLLAIAERMVDSLVQRAQARACALATLAVHLRLQDETARSFLLRPAQPADDRAQLCRLLLLEFAAHLPQAAVAALTLEATSGRIPNAQMGLFAAPAPSLLDATLLRLQMLTGSLCEIEHSETERAYDLPHNASMRQLVRTGQDLQLTLQDGVPAAFSDGATSYHVDATSGPWRSCGCWWNERAWDQEEWDVLATNLAGQQTFFLLVRNRQQNTWQQEAILR